MMWNGHKKYPRTFHLPWSETVSKDDKVLKDISHFINEEVVISEKMDGECFNLYNDYIHARSLEQINHSSQYWLKSFHATIKHNIPKGWRICGEYLYAKHSVEYNNLESYFLVFSIWNETNNCLDWESTKFWCELLNLKIVPIFFEGRLTEEIIEEIKNKKKYIPNNFQNCEGYVIRLKKSFPYNDFRNNIAKFVRKNHVDEFAKNWKMTWYESPTNKNGLRK